MSSTLDATTQGALYQELLDNDSRSVPEVYRWNSPMGDAQLRVPVSRTLMSEITVKDQKVWEMAWGADEQKVLELFSGYAVQNQVRHSGNLACVDPSGAPVTIDLAEIHDFLSSPAGIDVSVVEAATVAVVA